MVGFFKKIMAKIIGTFVTWMVLLLVRTARAYYKSPLWVKLLIFVFIITLVSIPLNTCNIFVSSDAGGTLIGVLTLQTAFAVYIITISGEEHVKRMSPVISRIFASSTNQETQDRSSEAEELLRKLSPYILGFPQRLAVFVLAFDIALSPLVLVMWQFIHTWISVMTVLSTWLLLWALLLVRIEVFESWLTRICNKIASYIERHGKELLVGVVVMYGVVALTRWWNNTNSATAKPVHEPKGDSL